MKLNRIVIRFALSLALLAGGAASVHAQESTPPATTNTARIYFAGGSGTEPDQNICSFEVAAGEYKFNGGSNNDCTNDDMYWYRLENAPSAALITLHAEDDCRNGGDWYFTVRTYINPVTVGWQKISDLEHLKAGDIVTRGLMYEAGVYDKGDVGGKISCVTIDY